MTPFTNPNSVKHLFTMQIIHKQVLNFINMFNMHEDISAYNHYKLQIIMTVILHSLYVIFQIKMLQWGDAVVD